MDNVDVYDDENNEDGDDKNDNKARSPGRAGREPLHIDRTSPQIFCTDHNYFHPKYSAGITIIFSNILHRSQIFPQIFCTDHKYFLKHSALITNILFICSWLLNDHSSQSHLV